MCLTVPQLGKPVCGELTAAPLRRKIQSSWRIAYDVDYSGELRGDESTTSQGFPWHCTGTHDCCRQRRPGLGMP